MDITHFQKAGETHQKPSYTDEELFNLIETTECVIAYFGPEEEKSVVIRLKSELETYQRIREWRK